MNEIEALLHSQFLELQRTPGVESIEMTPDIYRWTVVIAGFTGSPYEGGVFPILFDFSDGFPNKFPKIMFICPMFHPNVDYLGFIRLDNFEDPVLHGINICGIVSFIHSLMSEPNIDYNENEEATRIYLTDKKEFARKVQRIVNQSMSYC